MPWRPPQPDGSGAVFVHHARNVQGEIRNLVLRERLAQPQLQDSLELRAVEYAPG